MRVSIDVDVLIYDCEPLSAHLGVRIDGVLGFPLFRETLLTLGLSGQSSRAAAGSKFAAAFLERSSRSTTRGKPR